MSDTVHSWTQLALGAGGRSLIEASAGTGKTWTIGALVTRFVAEGEARLEEMLVVTDDGHELLTSFPLDEITVVD